MVAVASRPDIKFVVRHSHMNEPAPSARLNTRALRVGTASRASGRRAVRFITLSMSASTTQFSALALAAASIPPISVLKISNGFTVPRSASSIAGMVVTSSNSMIRGLVSDRYANNVLRTARIRRGSARSRILT